MYKLFLCLRYLRKRRIAFFSIGAVTLCTAMVIIVMSVLGGFLGKYKEAAQGIFGDIIIDGPGLVGFPYYEELLTDLRKAPEIRAATPVIYAYGLVRLWRGNTQGIRIIGVDPAGKDQVSTFKESLQQQKGHSGPPSFAPPEALRKTDRREVPGCIFGYDVIHFYGEDNKHRRRVPLHHKVFLTTMPLTISGALVGGSAPRARTRGFYYVDDSKSKVWDLDSSSVYVELNVLQKMLEMDTFTDDKGRTRPARVNQIQIKLADGVSLTAGKATIRKIHQAFAKRHPLRLIRESLIQTWEEKQAMHIGALVKERNLVTIMFAIISVVAVFLVFCIFFMIVVEKTKDIGIIKGVGGTSGGVATIFLWYGAAIGIVGAILGAVGGVLFVRNINEIHDWLAKNLGWQVWDPKVYIFDRIPDQVDYSTVAFVCLFAVGSAILGALLPAIKAARMNPVEALRYE